MGAAAADVLDALAPALPAAGSWLAMRANADVDAEAGAGVNGRVSTRSAREAQWITGACEHSATVMRLRLITCRASQSL